MLILPYTKSNCKELFSSSHEYQRSVSRFKKSDIIFMTHCPKSVLHKLTNSRKIAFENKKSFLKYAQGS